MRHNPPTFNEEQVIKAMQSHYDLLGVKMPKITIETDLTKAFDAAWGAARGAAATATGLKDKETLRYIKIEGEILKALENGLGWYFPMKDNLILVPFPKVTVDKDQRLHNEKEPAVDWKGGAKFYFYHGVKVPEKVILTPNKLDKKDWSKEKNTEVRRIIQEKMGSSFPKKIGCKLIDKPSGEFKKHNLLGLYAVNLPNDPDKVAHYVRVKDHSTKREFYLRTPTNIDDADESLAWTFGKKVNEYNPIVES